MIEDKERRIEAEILAAADLKGRKVLEIGCGSGRVTAMLAGLPRQMVAVDTDAGPVKAAKARVSRALFAVGSGEDLPFGSESFDVAVFTLSLHHQKSAMALAEAVRVLKPGGCLLAVEPEPDGEIERICCLVEDESRELARAADVLAHFPLAYEKTFSTDWVFGDRAELCRWLFAYYGKDPEKGIARRVERLLGPRADQRPLHLKDDLRIVRIDKEGSHGR